MRELISHKANGCNDNDAIDISVIDEPGHGGACHHYRVSIVPPECWEPQLDGSEVLDIEKTATKRLGFDIKFQNGPIKEVGTNGVTHEALLAIIEDRLMSFQAGPYACPENAIALAHIQDAMHWLQHRTRARLARGVEGTHAK